MSTDEAKSRKLVPSTQSIITLQTDIARTSSHLHPALLLAYYLFRFPALVDSPTTTLFIDLLPISLLQLAYAVTCLPAHRSTETQQSVAKPTKPNSRKKPTLPPKNHESLSGSFVPALLALTLTILPSAPVLYIILVLFGAPLTTHHAQTALCAAHLSILAVFPLFYVHGVSSKTWREIIGAMLPFDEVWGATVFCFLGAWLGAVPIPLDWDREWQKWPVTIVTGAYGGYLFGKLIGKYVLAGKRIEFD
ncbi:Glycosylphosphatidylinositol (GPI) anchor assembly protein [Varicellaria rhodocarpa]|nr:Glycosylphosphatidylinositol (GPI) anchor assembly protein [Varicellaria rhodocarpa]